MYRLARPLLFQLPAEFTHHLGIAALRAYGALLGAVLRDIEPLRGRPVEAMGLRFENPIGLAAGLDKDGRALRGLAGLGFGFIEVGTVTPRPQPGNPKPRMFRYPQQQALINRLGFNNLGVAALVKQLEAHRAKLPGTQVGVNIGKNKDTPLSSSVDDYVLGLRAVYPVADYVTLNLSSPNTPGLRELQGAKEIAALLGAVTAQRDALAGQQGRRVPIAVKIAPDLSDVALRELAAVLLDLNADAVIATNTTITRPPELPEQAGGLSGSPLTELSVHVVDTLANQLQGRLPIIGVGGINSAANARKFMDAGADLVQIYTGLIYKGPKLVRQLALLD